MGFKLRPYQKKVADKLDSILETHDTCLVVGPPGIGKGTMIAYEIAKCLAAGERCLFAVHRDLLVTGKNSLEQRLVEQMKIPKKYIGFAMGNMRQQNRMVMLATVQTAVNRKLYDPKYSKSFFSKVFVDEAHRFRPKRDGVKDGQYQQLWEYLQKQRKPPKLVGFTATPERMSKLEPLGLVFSSVLQVMTHHDAVKRKFLVPSRIVGPVTPDLTGVRVRGGEYVEKDLEEIAYNDEALEEIADKVMEYWYPGAKCITYSINSVKSCHKIRDIFRARGLSVEAITANTPRRDPYNPSPKDRTGILDRLEKGHLDMVVNVSVLTEGLSVDSVNMIVLAYSTLVRGKYIQCVTRASRPLWGDGDWLKVNGDYAKPGYLVIDCGNNAWRFGSPEEYLRDGVDISVNTTWNKKQKPPMKRCPNCSEIIHTSIMTCPNCGYQFPRQSDDKVLAGQTEWVDYTSDSKMGEVLRLMGFKKRDLEALFGNTRRPELLIPVSLMRRPGGNDLGWAVDVAYKHRYFSKLKIDGEWVPYDQIDPRSEQHWIAILEYLEGAVDRAGYRDVVEGIIYGDDFNDDKFVAI